MTHVGARSTIVGSRRSRPSPRMPSTRTGTSCSPSMLCPTCLPTSALPAPSCFSTLLLAQIDHRRAEWPRPAALAAVVLGLAGCSLWRLFSARGRGEARSYADFNFRAKWRVPWCDTAAPCGPHMRCPCMSCSGKVWAHATRRRERSGGAAEGERRPWKRARALILAGVIDGEDGVGLAVRSCAVRG